MRAFIGVLLFLVSGYMIFNGAFIFYNTLGVVRSTEYSMLITLTNQLGAIMVWLGLFAVWRMCPPSEEKDLHAPAGEKVMPVKREKIPPVISE